MPTDGAVQSRARFGRAQGRQQPNMELELLSITTDESSPSRRQTFIYYARVKNKSVNKAIAQNGGIPGFLHPFMWGCSVPGERKGSSQPFTHRLEPQSPGLNSHHHSPQLHIKRIYRAGLLPSPSLIPDFKAWTQGHGTELPPIISLELDQSSQLRPLP